MSCPHLLILPYWRTTHPNEVRRVLDLHRATCAVCEPEDEL